MASMKAIIVAEDEYVETLEFATKAERDAYGNGLGRGAGIYGAGGCGLYSLDDLEGEFAEDGQIADLIRKHLATDPCPSKPPA